MLKALVVVTILLGLYVQPVPALRTCTNFSGSRWYCTFSCCYDYIGCCDNYWYAWTITSVIFLICLCSCAGFGGYRYQRRYYYTQTTPGVTHTVVTSANTNMYQAGVVNPPPPQSAYQPYSPPKDAPPPYNPATMAMEKPPAYNY